MDVALLAVVITLAIVGGLFVGALAILSWRRLLPRRDEHGVLTEAWRREQIGGHGDRGG